MIKEQETRLTLQENDDDDYDDDMYIFYKYYFACNGQTYI